MYNKLVTLSFINNLVTLSSVTMFGHINFIFLKCYFKSNNGGKKYPLLLKVFLAWFCLVTKLCLTLFRPHGHSPPGFSVQGLLQARILEWVAITFSRT